jgi:hypothetical protein
LRNDRLSPEQSRTTNPYPVLAVDEIGRFSKARDLHRNH